MNLNRTGFGIDNFYLGKLTRMKVSHNFNFLSKAKSVLSHLEILTKRMECLQNIR